MYHTPENCGIVKEEDELVWHGDIARVGVDKALIVNLAQKPNSPYLM